jgi:hypothetical protein
MNSSPDPDGTFPLASAQEAKRLRARMSWKRKTTGGVLAFIGYMLSPLSWWNDAFVNVPLALAFAWIVELFYKLSVPGGHDHSRARAVFGASWIVGYWLTNVLGFVLMHKGAQKILREEEKKYSWRDAVRDIGISLLYTTLIVLLLKLGIVKPIENYVTK